MSSVKQGEVQQGNFKKALETIVFIMNGSIDAGTTLNLDSEASTSSNSESSIDLNSQVSSEVDSDTVSDPYLETTNTDLDPEKVRISHHKPVPFWIQVLIPALSQQ